MGYDEIWRGVGRGSDCTLYLVFWVGVLILVLIEKMGAFGRYSFQGSDTWRGRSTKH